jgi:hypothetical protein
MMNEGKTNRLEVDAVSAEFKHSGACVCPACNPNPSHNQGACLEEIKKLFAVADLHALESFLLSFEKKRTTTISPPLGVGGRYLSDKEALEFICRPIILGKPTVQPGRRGPKSKKSQYDLAYERRKDPYRRLVKLKNGVRLGTGNQRIADEVRDLIRTLRAEGFHERSIVREIRNRFELAGKPIDETTIRRIKRTMK